MRKDFVISRQGRATCTPLQRITVRKKDPELNKARGTQFSHAKVFLTVIKAPAIEEAVIEPPCDPPHSSSLHNQVRVGTISEY